MHMKFLVCSMLLVAGCSGGGKPSEVGGDASVTAPSTGNTGDNPGGCGGRACASGETCVSYYGIAGPRGPQFHECVIPCKRGAPNDGCPTGKKCATVADGPGDVCQ